MNSFFLFQSSCHSLSTVARHVIYAISTLCHLLRTGKGKEQITLWVGLRSLQYVGCNSGYGPYILDNLTRRENIECCLRNAITLSAWYFDGHRHNSPSCIIESPGNRCNNKRYVDHHPVIPESVISWRHLKVPHNATIKGQNEPKDPAWRSELEVLNISSVSDALHHSLCSVKQLAVFRDLG